MKRSKLIIKSFQRKKRKEHFHEKEYQKINAKGKKKKWFRPSGPAEAEKNVFGIPRQMEINGFELLHMQVGHVAKLTSLPFHHRDPFDRMLISQCLADKLFFVSSDSVFESYSVRRIW